MASRWTLLQITQHFCRRRGLPIPTAVIGTNNDTLRQVLGLLEEAVLELADEWDWSELKKSGSFQHAGGGSTQDYLAYSFGGNDPTTASAFATMKDFTLWDATNREPVAGPLSDAAWQAMITQGISPASYSYRIGGGGLQIWPEPAPLNSVTFTFQGVLTRPILRSNGTDYSDTFANDADTPLLDYNLILKGLRWRWNKEKGLPYAEEKDEYQNAVITAINSDGSAPKLSLDNQKLFDQVVAPGLLIPAGNWNV